MPLAGNAVEAVAVAFDFVVKREGLHLYILGLVNRHWRGAADRSENDFEIRTVSKERGVELQHRTQGLGAVYISRSGAAIHSHGAAQAEKSEYVVAVDVGDEDRVYLQ